MELNPMDNASTEEYAQIGSIEDNQVTCRKHGVENKAYTEPQTESKYESKTESNFEKRVSLKMGNDEELPEQESGVIYKLEEVPPPHICLLLGLQHFLMMAPGSVTAPLIMAAPLCLLDDDPARGYLVTSVFFVCGFVTLVQTVFGTRLPIIQAATAAVFLPVLTILEQPEWKCPEEAVLRNMTEAERTEQWQIRIRETQGAIVVASLVEVILGMTGAVGLLLRWITPLVITPVITMIGLSLIHSSAKKAGKHWGIASLCVLLVVVMSQYMRNVKLPIPVRGEKGGKKVIQLPVFALFSVILSIAIGWMICFILTATDVFEEGSSARTDRNFNLVHETPWFYFPYPGQWGLSTVSAGAVIGVIAGILASAIDSVGDYYACARISGEPPPPPHAINRGILLEGLGCIMAGIYGTGCGISSKSSNIAAIGITRVASRRVIQVAGVLMMLCGVIGKMGALFVTIPDPVIGGIFICIFGMLTAVGLSTLQFVNLNSARNLFILGLSLFLSMVSYDYLADHPKAIDTGSTTADSIFSVLLKTRMFLAGFIAFILDNTVPGSNEERGLEEWKKQTNPEQYGEGGEECESYNPPFTAYLKRWPWTRYIPFIPSYKNEKPQDI